MLTCITLCYSFVFVPHNEVLSEKLSRYVTENRNKEVCGGKTASIVIRKLKDQCYFLRLFQRVILASVMRIQVQCLSSLHAAQYFTKPMLSAVKHHYRGVHEMMYVTKDDSFTFLFFFFFL